MTKLIKSNSHSVVSQACDVLYKGGIIVYPTDTLYGLGCDSKNEATIRKINKLKGRSGPISVIAPNKLTAISWMSLERDQKKNVRAKLDNGNTVIAPAKKNICSNLIMGEGKTLGIRIPEHNFCKELSSLFPNPITSTSVNRSGQSPHSTSADILSDFKDEIDLIVDDGIINGSGSKIFLLKNNVWEQLR